MEEIDLELKEINNATELLEDRKNSKSLKAPHLLYGVNDPPPWLTSILFGVQQVMVCASGVVAGPLLVVTILCGQGNPFARVKLIGSTMVVCGLGTFMQSTFGVRLPLLQGPTFAFIPPLIAMMKIPEYECPASTNIEFNETSSSYSVFEERMQVTQGALLSAAAFEMFLGMTGLIGLVTKFVGPLTIAPLMICLAISAVDICVIYTSQHWISVIMIGLLVLTALYLHLLKVPLPTYNKKDKCHISNVLLFAMFPYLIAITFVWTLAIILTTTNVIDKEKHSTARTDLRSQIIYDAPWFNIPYPGQWGPLKFNVGVFLGMIAGTLASVIESIGDYYGCARTCHEPPPPSHATNRGILIEGFACLIGGFIGTGTGVTTYSENIGVIGITKVASRRTMQIAGCLFILLGMCTKVGAVLSTLPDPIVGGILTVSLATVGGVGMASLQLVDLKLSRNMAVLGLSVFIGVLVPTMISKNPFNTGNYTLDQLFTLLCSMKMFVAGVTGFILDNTVPGATRVQRGLVHKDDHHQFESNSSTEKLSIRRRSVYTFGPKVMKFISKIPFSTYIPFLPTHSDDHHTILSEI